MHYELTLRFGLIINEVYKGNTLHYILKFYHFGMTLYGPV